MSASAPSFDFRLIDTPAGSLPCIIRGSPADTPLLIIPPLFEEMNRTRALLAGVGRRLAERGIASWLPDLPGTGDSELPFAEASWDAWQQSLELLAQKISATHGKEVHIFTIRGGALLGESIPARSRYWLSPVAGERLLRELLRARMAADQERGTPTSTAALEAQLATQPVELAGYPVSLALAAALRAAALPEVAPVRRAVVGSGDGDISLDGPPLWRHAEPAAAPALAEALADDIAAWIARCAGR
ncbi:hypothetical protein ACFOMD_14845 [Sphingoaurantiacus capsulatus]|uniref:Alpha/beta hydrolase n=1 Tax=Sphingoaurantiacus capsulatus TaxID=1771310 RepID=A0ABV7XEY0_9SPHN